MGSFCFPDQTSSEIELKSTSLKADDADSRSISQIDDKSFKDFVIQTCNLKNDLQENEKSRSLIQIMSEA
jgi:hypothetical protein